MTYRIGVDGGATKTECLLVDESGAVVLRHLAPGCNPNVMGAEAAERAVAGALSALLAGAGPGEIRIASTLLCMAGPLEFWRGFAARRTDLGRILAVDDSLPVLELATEGGPGLVLHGGTGSFVAARTGSDLLGGAHYAGGLGWRLGDPGSGYDLGRRAIARGLMELQGWLPPSGFGALVRGHTGLADAAAITRQLYADPSPNARMAGLASRVLDLASGGDPAAAEIVAASVTELLGLAERVAAGLFPGAAMGSLRAGLSGPILTHPFVLTFAIQNSDLALRPVSGSPAEGVRRMLLRLG
jgi:N-acetylglucosamine kinase-like BadF-type ATPase